MPGNHSTEALRKRRPSRILFKRQKYSEHATFTNSSETCVTRSLLIREVRIIHSGFEMIVERTPQIHHRHRNTPRLRRSCGVLGVHARFSRHTCCVASASTANVCTQCMTYALVSVLRRTCYVFSLFFFFQLEFT